MFSPDTIPPTTFSDRQHTTRREQAVKLFSAGERLTAQQLARKLDCHIKTARRIITDLSPPLYPLTEEKVKSTRGKRGPRATVYFFVTDKETDDDASER